MREMSDDQKLIRLIAKRLRTARQDKGLTQAQVAQGAGIADNHYALIERGERNPTITTLMSIMRVLEVTPSEILSDSK
jgi:transcriptional regulator with XRE-family HTH domain